MRNRLIVLVALSFLTCCRKPAAKEEAPPAAAQAEGLSVTHWTDRTELFMEYPALVPDNRRASPCTSPGWTTFGRSPPVRLRSDFKTPRAPRRFPRKVHRVRVFSELR